MKKQKKKKTIFFLRIWKSFHKRGTRKVVTKEAIKAFYETHKQFWLALRFILPAVLTIVLGFFIFIIMIACGVRFQSEAQLWTIIIIGGSGFFYLFYELVKNILNHLIE